jgi:UDP-N-acetylmuramoyl-L-alanyl-D-glutamate--2,6-diaminopimelate ligase
MKRNLQKLIANLLPDYSQIPPIPISGLCTGSKLANPGDLFVAIPGTQVDGHNFIDEAILNGAAAVITNGRELGTLSIPQIKVANPRRALSYVASAFFGHPSRDLTVIGITGTNGKTTTASIVTSILRNEGYKTAQMGTLGLLADGFPVNPHLTTEDPIVLHTRFAELLKQGYTHIVMEVSSHALHQHRVADVEFDYAVFTNLTPEHLDYHKTMEDYYHAKVKLFKGLSISATAIVNLDSPYGKNIRNDCSSPVLTTSLSSVEDVHFLEFTQDINGTRGKVLVGEQEYIINSNLTGRYNLENLLNSVALSYAMGFSRQSIENGITKCRTIPGRMEIFYLPDGRKAVIDYAHTPDAFVKVLSTIKDIINGSKITVVFGAGGERDTSKRPVIASITEKFANRVFITPDNPRSEDVENINADLISGFTKKIYKIFESRATAIRHAVETMESDEIIVILGKGREDFQEIKGVKYPHSDVAIIEEFIV